MGKLALDTEPDPVQVEQSLVVDSSSSQPAVKVQDNYLAGYQQIPERQDHASVGMYQMPAHCPAEPVTIEIFWQCC